MALLATTGAMTLCSFGTAPSSLMVLPPSRALTPLPLANILDTVPFVNVLPFGMCTSLANPAVAAATAAALGVLTPMPCTPTPAGPWVPGVPTVLVGNLPAVDIGCKLMCAYGGVIQFTAPAQTTVSGGLEFLRMPRDLTRLRQPLAPDEEPGLSSSDPRLLIITDLAERRAFREAADLADEMLGEGIFDIRVISILMFQAFIEGGFPALEDVMNTLTVLLSDNFEAVGPARRREEHFGRRLIWLFDAITDAIAYHATKRTADWERWLHNQRSVNLLAAVEAGERLTSKLQQEVFRTAHTSLSRVLEALRVHASELAASVVNEPAPMATQAPPAAKQTAPVPSARKLDDSDDFEPVRRKVELVVSHAFLELTAKIRAFEALIEQRNFEKAALVSDDILATLDAFDPRLYFPELLGHFSALISRNIETLSNHWAEREGPAWKAMNQHYRVDLKGFVEKD